MINISHDSLLKHLKALGLKPEFQQETDQVFVVFQYHEHDFPLFLRILEEDELLQLLIFMPMGCRPSAKGDLARLLHYLNKEIDTPGFGMDESANVIFYRLVIATKGKKIATDLFDAYFTCTQKVTETFFPAIAAVSQGQLTFDEFLKKTNAS